MSPATRPLLAAVAVLACIAGVPGPAFARIVKYEPPTAVGDTPIVQPSEATGDLATIDAIIGLRRAVEERAAGATCDLVSVPLPSPADVLARVGRLPLPTERVCGEAMCAESFQHDDSTHPFGMTVTATIPNVGPVLIARPTSQAALDKLAANARQFGRIHFFSVSSNATRAFQNLFRSAAFAAPLLSGGHSWTVIDPDRSSFESLSHAYACLRAGRWRKSDGSAGPDKAPRDSDLLVFVSDDVFLLPTFELELYSQLASLYKSDPAWCAVGASTSSKGAPRAGGHWAGGFTPVWAGFPQSGMQLPSSSLLAMLRGAHAQFDPSVRGRHCLGADVGLSCSSSGLASHVHPATGMAIAINPWGPAARDQSAAGQQSGAKASRQEEARSLASKWSDLLPLEGTGTDDCPLG